MKKRHKIYTMILCLLLIGLTAVMNSFGQDGKKQVKSIIKDSLGRTISGAVVYGREGSNSARTGQDGIFQLELAPSDFVFIEANGFEPKMIQAGDIDTGAGIVLEKAKLMMGNINKINVPFGTMNKRQFVGAVDVINAQEVLKYDANQSVYAALNGRISGNYGIMGVRGTATALVVIDGFPRASFYDDPSFKNFDLLNSISMSEVEQIVLLKDGLSRMLYGAKAGQPILLITTRRGTPLKRTLEVSAEKGINTVRGNYPNYLGSADYMDYYNKALVNDGLAPLYSQSAIESTRNGSDPVLYPDQEYYNSAFLKNLTNFHRLAVETSGGNERAQYYSSLIWNSRNDLYKMGEGADDRNNQFSFRGNVDYKLNSWIKVRLDALAQYGANRVANASFWSAASTMRPNAFPLLLPVDRVISANRAVLASAKIFDGKYILGGTDQFRTNLYGDFDRGGYSMFQNRTVVVGSGIEIDLKKITDGLKARAYYSFDALNGYKLNYASTYKVYKPVFVGDSINIGTSYGTDTKATAQSFGNPQLYKGSSLYGTLDYSRVFAEKHAVSATALGYWSSVKQVLVYNMLKNQHGGLRANYMYDNRLVAEISATYTGSGKLEKGNRYRLSKGIGVGWVISEENFMKRTPKIDYLKLKASFANIKNELGYPGYFLYQTLYDAGSTYAYNQTSGNNNTGRIFSVVGNPDLGFVDCDELNIGFESLLFDKHLSVELNYFTNTIANKVVRKSSIYPVFMGVLPYENFAKSRTNGTEVKVNYTGQIGKINYNLGAYMTFAGSKNLVVDEVYDSQALGLRAKGESTTRILGYVADGLFKDASDISSHVPQFGVVLNPGDIKYKDLNGDGKVDSKDQKTIGDNMPDMTYGLEATLNYKNWSLNVVGFGQTGSSGIFSDSYYWINSSSVKYSVNAKDYWTPGNASVAKYPRLSTGANSSNSNNFRTSTFWLEKTNFFSVQRVQLTYSCIVENSWLKGLDIYLRGSDLALLSPAKEKLLRKPGNDPAFTPVTFPAGSDDSKYYYRYTSSMSIFAIGCSLKF